MVYTFMYAMWYGTQEVLWVVSAWPLGFVLYLMNEFAYYVNLCRPGESTPIDVVEELANLQMPWLMTTLHIVVAICVVVACSAVPMNRTRQRQ